MRKLRVISIAAAGVAVISMITPVAASAKGAVPARPVIPHASTIGWGTCTSATLQRFGAECALVDVPLDYANPGGTKIQLAVSRVKHKVPDSQYQGVMLVNPGGPGGSGQIYSILQGFVPNGAGNAYDWIGFDPRGVGSSVPAVSCDANYFDFNRPSYIPVQTATLQKWLARSKGYAEDCAANNGAILQHLTTIDSAKDMNTLRVALGADQINYYGFSYGTYLGQVYGTLFPDKLRRAVFDSTVDPRRIWYAANLDQDVAFNSNIKIWFGWLAQYDAVYHLGKTEKAVEALFYKIEAKLTFAPAQGKIGGDEWVDLFLNAGYYQQTWLDLAQLFSDYVVKGDVASLIATYADTNTPGAPGADNGFAVYLGVQCTDTPWPQDWKTWSRDNWRIFAQAPFETWGNAWFNAPCIYWPAPAHKPVEIDGSKVKSLLLVDETLDAATPYSGSLEVRKRFPNSSLIALPGGTSHANSLNGDACLDNQIADYLATGALPARRAGDGADTTCTPLPVPVPDAAAAKKAAATTSGGSSALAGLGLVTVRR